MNQVFEETSISTIKLKNRIIRSATHEGMADENGYPTAKLIKKYEALAKGEVGAIITGYAGISQNGKSPLYRMSMIDNDDSIEPYRELVDTVHQYHTPIVLQIAHCGRQTRSAVTGLPTVAPSPIRDRLYDEDLPLELDEDGIRELVHGFVAAIVRAKKAGFDGAQLHLAHGYLLSSFLSPHMNKRTDQWGGNRENRFRMVQEIMELSRKAVGNYPILAKISASERSKDGINLADAVDIAQRLEKSGCDAIEVSCGIAEDGFMGVRGQLPYEILFKYNNKLKNVPGFLHPFVKLYLNLMMSSPKPHELYNLSAAEEIKKHVKIPVIVVGGIRSIDQINGIIEKGQCEFVSMSRPFIIESDIVKKLKEGKQTASKCINCNYCLIGGEVEAGRCYYGKLKPNLNHDRHLSEKGDA